MIFFTDRPQEETTVKPHTQAKVDSMATLRGQVHSTTLYDAAVGKAFAARDGLRAADKLEISLVELSIGFALNHPAISSVIIGPRTEDHLKAYLKAADTLLGESVLDAVDELVPPGTNFVERDAGAIVPSLEYAELRRR